MRKRQVKVWLGRRIIEPELRLFSQWQPLLVFSIGTTYMISEYLKAAIGSPKVTLWWEDWDKVSEKALKKQEESLSSSRENLNIMRWFKGAMLHLLFKCKILGYLKRLKKYMMSVSTVDDTNPSMSWVLNPNVQTEYLVRKSKLQLLPEQPKSIGARDGLRNKNWIIILIVPDARDQTW